MVYTVSDKFARERKFIRHCINQSPTPNLFLKADIKSTPLILQTAKESRKVQVSLSEIDTLLFGNANYLTENYFVVNRILVINEHSYCLYSDKTIIDCLITTTLSLTENIKQHISKTS